jgi:hypothetical protein
MPLDRFIEAGGRVQTEPAQSNLPVMCFAVVAE